MGTKEGMERGAGKAGAVGTGYENLFAIIKKEHDEIALLLKQVSRSNAPANMRDLFIRLRRELLSHMKAEEEVFYDRLERAASARAEVRESLQEHEQIERLLERLGTISMGSDDWKSTLEDLKYSIESHVQEEEDEIFAMAQKVIDEEEAQRLGQRFQNEKREALARLSGPSAQA